MVQVFTYFNLYCVGVFCKLLINSVLRNKKLYFVYLIWGCFYTNVTVFMGSFYHLGEPNHSFLYSFLLLLFKRKT